MNRLRVRSTDGIRQDYPLHGEPVTIGRDPASTVCLKDSHISWKHAAIVYGPAGWMLEDLGSFNGTFIGKERIAKHGLNHGDVIALGPFELTFEVGTPTEAVAAGPSPLSSSERTLFEAADKLRQRVEAAEKDRPAGDFASPVVESTDSSARWRVVFGRIVPNFTWFANYDRSNLRDDLIAGVTVAALMIPQGMAYALLAGLPPAMGLYAAILPMIVYAFVGSGRQTSIGPVTVDSLIMVLGLSVLATAGTASYIALALMLTATIGALQLAMGVLRLGFLVNFLSYPVLAGFTSAIAISTALGQLKHLTGISQPGYPSLYRGVADIATRLNEASAVTLIVGIGGIVALLALRRWVKKIPGPLSLLIVCTALAFAFHLDTHGVHVLGDVHGGVPHLGWPAIHWDDLRHLLPLALTMALVGFAQTISVGKSLGNRYGYDVDANRELAALGLANLSSSLSQGIAVSGSLARSALNAEAGARTPLASIVCAFAVAIVTLLFTPLFHYLPQATLAAILVVSAVRLIDTREIRYLFKVKVTEGILLVFTVVATLTFGVMPGLLLGIVASILLFITLNTRPHMAILGRLPNTNIFRNVRHFPEAQILPGLVILRIDASLYFANVEFLKEKIHEICERNVGDLKAIILDASAVNDLDSSADTAMHQLSAELTKKSIDFYIAGIKAPVREVMKRSGLYDHLSGDHFFFTIDAAVKRFQEKSQQG